MTQTPNSLRIQIGIFGRTNSGKSSLLNALTNQDFSIVSPEAGTTADPVKKAMEIAGLGPVLFVDTAGFCDQTSLGEKRLEKTQDALARADLILAVFGADEFQEKSDFENCEKNLLEENSEENFFIRQILKSGKKFIPVLTKIDLASKSKIEFATKKIESLTKKIPVQVSSVSREGIENLFQRIRDEAKTEDEKYLTGNLCAAGDLVLLVMPQDIQAPKGRLILPQVQVLRDLLDKKCIVASCTADMFEQTLRTLAIPPKLIVIDSQVFPLINSLRPKNCALTSFSVLMATAKGKINLFKEGAAAIKNLNQNSRVLIAEACAHVPQDEDIGRIKIPRMLKKIAGDLKIDFVRGTDFPDSLTDENGAPRYDLIIHCGACMFNRAYVLHRQSLAEAAGIPMTNYGIAIAQISGILDEVVLP
ncbi:MAG: [FeFe] hydrogenase H-cluster maturation GTPase HydF [Treponemataceae bacterium]|nr:[FeFe] hydrogenase H-cluster maturation GTPase HydF [Treponemataceae bacterium]